MLTLPPPRSALYVPASNARAIEKAHGLNADLTIFDLEDAVSSTQKDAARAAAIGAAVDFGDKGVAIRINAVGTTWHDDDVAAVARAAIDYVVVPKVEDSKALAIMYDHIKKPLLPMIETPHGVYAARDIAETSGVAGVIMGNNDLAIALKTPARAGLITALHLTILAARAAGIWVLDGVYNALDDPEGFAAECAHGRMMGFDGKTLIHPNQLAACHVTFSPTDAEIVEANALVAAAADGAVRFRDRMVETMHVEAARKLLDRAQRR